MLLRTETLEIQQTLAQYCRTGELSKIPGVLEDRLHHYRRLVFNGINDTLKQAFPITLKVLGEEEWENVVDDFFKNHDCQNPQIWLLPFEFYEYIKNNSVACKLYYPHLIDLLYFEWIEIEIYTMTDAIIPEHRNTGDWLNNLILINPEHTILPLTYPVHLYKTADVIKHKGNYFLLVFREPETGVVQFLNISPLHTFFIERIAENILLTQILEEAAEIFNISDHKLLLDNILPFLADLKNRGAILGFI